jgi:hypothetical protein
MDGAAQRVGALARRGAPSLSRRGAASSAAAPRPRRRRPSPLQQRLLLLPLVLLLLCGGGAPRRAAAAPLSAVQSISAVAEQAALSAAEATLVAIQRQTGREMSLRGVPLDSLKVRRAAAARETKCAARAPAGEAPPRRPRSCAPHESTRARAPAAPQVFAGRQHTLSLEIDGVEYKAGFGGFGLEDSPLI